MEFGHDPKILLTFLFFFFSFSYELNSFILELGPEQNSFLFYT